MLRYVRQLSLINEEAASKGQYETARKKMEDARKQNDANRAMYTEGKLDRKQYEEWYKSVFLMADREYKMAEFIYQLDSQAPPSTQGQEGENTQGQAAPGSNSELPG
jgi:hypothetical protein